MHGRRMNVAAFIAICFPIIAYSCKSSSGKVKRTEISNNGEEIWTVGFRNRSLEVVVECTNCNGRSMTNDFTWCRGYPSCTEEINNQSTLAKWAPKNNTHLIYTLELYDMVEYYEENLFYGVRRLSDYQPLFVWNVSIKYCPKNNKNGVEILVPGGNYTYGSAGYFSCPKGDYLVDNMEKRLVTNTTTECGTYARWDREEKMECWRVPKVTVNRCIRPKAAGSKLRLKICHVSDYGRPQASVGLFQDNLPLSTPLTLQPEHNGMSLYCKADNELTDILNEGSLSKQFTIVVEFEPINYSEWTSCTATEANGLYNVTLHVSFSANPPVDKLIIFVDDKKQNVPSMSTSRSIGCCGAVPVQYYEITLTNVTKETKVTVEFNHKIQKLILLYNCVTGNCSNLQGLIEETTNALPENLPGTSIAIISIGVVIVLILVAGLFTYIHHTKGQNSSPRHDGRNNVKLTSQSASTDCPQAQDSERRRESAEVPYENNEVHAYQEIREEKNKPSYQNIGEEFNCHQNEAYEYTIYGE